MGDWICVTQLLAELAIEAMQAVVLILLVFHVCLAFVALNLQLVKYLSDRPVHRLDLWPATRVLSGCHGAVLAVVLLASMALLSIYHNPFAALAR